MNNRLDYIDATKGVAILCIAFLHFEKGVIPFWLNEWIGMFMITAFYVTSGWIIGIRNKRMKPNELLNKRIKQLGVPYLWFSLLIILFDMLWVIFGFMESYILLRDIYKTLTLRGIGTLWFLPVLVMGEYIFAIIRNNKKKLLIAAIFLLITLTANYVYNNVWLPLRDISELNKLIDAPIRPFIQAFNAWPIIALGYIIAKIWGQYIQKMNKIALFVLATLLIGISVMLIVAPPFSIHYINGILCNTLPAFAFMFLFSIFTKNIITRFCCYWGVNSLILMCTHYSITMEVIMTLDKYIINHHIFEGPITILYFTVCVLLTYPLVYLFNGRLRFMIGKK